MRYLDEVTRSKLRELPSNDQILSDAIKRSRVVLGETGLASVVSDLDTSLPVTGLAMLGEDPQPFLFDFPGLLRNVPLLEHAAAGRGLITIKTERDGIIRRVPMMMRAQDQTMPSLSFEILRLVTGTPTIIIKSEKAGIKSVTAPRAGASDRSQRPALGPFRPSGSFDLCFGQRRARRDRPGLKRSRASWCWSAPRRSDSTTSRPRR